MQRPEQSTALDGEASDPDHLTPGAGEVRARRGPWRRPIAVHPATWITLGALAVLALVIGLFGGWRHSGVAEIPRIEGDEPVALGPYEARVNGWDLIERVPIGEDAAMTYIALDLTLTGTSKVDVNYLSNQTFRPASFSVLYAQTYLRSRDLTMAMNISVGISDRYILLFEPEGEVPEEDEETLAVVLTELEWRPQNLSGERGWWERGDIGWVEVPRDRQFLDDLRAADAANAELMGDS